MALSSTTAQLTTREAADRCGFDYRHWLKLRARGQTPPPDSFEGRQARYSPETVDRWFAERGGKASWRLSPVESTEVEAAVAVSADDTSEQAA